MTIMGILKSSKMAIVWTVLRVWLGIQWIEAGYHKIADGFDAGGFLMGAIAKSTGEHPAVAGWYATFLKEFALPNVDIINAIIPYAEVAVGLGLIVGLLTIPALLGGTLMNLNFMLAGTTSTNPILMTVAFILLYVGAKCYVLGLDKIAVPYTKNMLNKYNNHIETTH
jgi:thiosulfate dehydrogenase [quinone] large subunit